MRGFARVSAAVPAAHVADFDANAVQTLSLWKEAHTVGSAVVVFPELGLCGYSTRDLLQDAHLQARCLDTLRMLRDESASLAPLAIVGLPLRLGGALYNVAAVVHRGRILGVVAGTLD